MVAQRITLCILRVEVLSYQVHMNLDYFEALVASSVFDKLLKATHDFLLDSCQCSWKPQVLEDQWHLRELLQRL